MVFWIGFVGFGIIVMEMQVFCVEYVGVWVDIECDVQICQVFGILSCQIWCEGFVVEIVDVFDVLG